MRSSRRCRRAGCRRIRTTSWSTRPAISSSAVPMRLRPHRPQDHCRHLWRLRAPWRRRLLRQGPGPGRSVRGLRGALSRKNVVAAGLADQCTIQVAYAIGVADPMSLRVQMQGGNVDEEKLAKVLREIFPMRPTHIRRALKLCRPIYLRTRDTAISAARRTRMAASPGRRPSRRRAQAGAALTQKDKRAFFGRRKGHALKPQQAALFDTCCRGLRLTSRRRRPQISRPCFRIRSRRCGSRSASAGRTHMIAEAEQAPQTGFIGTIRSSMPWPRRCGNRCARPCQYPASLRGRDLPDRMAAGGLDRARRPYLSRSVAKRRHWKRRFVQDATLAEIARILRAAASSASSPTGPTTPPGRFRTSCARRISNGPPSAPTTAHAVAGLYRARATKPRPSVKGARPAI